MPRSIDSTLIAIVRKDLRTNRAFLGLAALAHLLYVALIVQALAPGRYEGAVEPLRRMSLSGFVQTPMLGVEISIILALAALVLVQTDGLAEPHHDSHIRPITPFQILGAKFIGLSLVVFAPRFLLDLAGSLLFHLSLPEGVIAAGLHLLSDAATAVIVVAVATVTSTLGQALLATLLATLALVIAGLVPTWLRAFGAFAGADLSTIGRWAMILAAETLALLMLICCGTPSPRRSTRKLAALGLLVFPAIAVIDFFIVWEPQAGRDGDDAQISAEALSPGDTARIRQRSGTGPRSSGPFYLAVRTFGHDDWLAIGPGEVSPPGHPSADLIRYDDDKWAEKAAAAGPNGFRRVLVFYGESMSGNVDSVSHLKLDITGMTRLGAVPLTHSRRYRAVPGGGACRLVRFGRKGEALCVAALESPCVTFGYPVAPCPEPDLIHLFRWPLPWTTSSSFDHEYDPSAPRDPKFPGYPSATTAYFWCNQSRFTRSIPFKPGELRKLMFPHRDNPGADHSRHDHPISHRQLQ